MQSDEDPEPMIEYGSLEEMDAWLTQLDSTKPSPASRQNATREPSKAPNTRHTLSDVTQENTPTTSHSLFASKEPTAPASKTPTKTLQQQLETNQDSSKSNKTFYSNDKKVNMTSDKSDGISENMWLESLLEEQNKSEKEAEALENSADLSKLLATTTTATPPDKVKKNRGEIPTQTQPLVRYQRIIAAILWIAGCSVLILLLLAQYVIFNLNTLMKTPEHAARLQAICSMAACSLPYADITALSTTDPTYRASRIAAAAEFSDIEVNLVNQSAQAQLLPDLKVRIYKNDAIIGEFIAAPKDYVLGAQQQLNAMRSQPLMFTVPIAASQISKVTIDVIY